MVSRNGRMSLICWAWIIGASVAYLWQFRFLADLVRAGLGWP